MPIDDVTSSENAYQRELNAADEEETMPETKIYGASDDLIELKGQISEEFNHYVSGDDEENAYLAFSDGTLLNVVYDKDGIWRISRLAVGSCAYEHTPGSVPDDTNDVAILRGELKWCVMAKAGDSNPAYAQKGTAPQ